MDIRKIKSLLKPEINIEEVGKDSVNVWIKGETNKHEFDFDGSEESLARKIKFYYRFNR